MYNMKFENIDKIIEKWSALDAENLLKDIFEKFGTQAAIGTSLQKTGLVIMDIASQVVDKIRVFTVDTGRLFPETISFMKEVEDRYAKKLHNNKIEIFNPNEERLEKMIKQSHWREYLFLESPSKRNYCCNIRKVEPTYEALKTLTVWVTGLRKDQSKFRSTLPKIQRIDIEGKNIVKVSPLYSWTETMIDEYMAKRNVPIHPLYSQGYTSIGCKQPCTTLSLVNEDIRKARWRWELEDDSAKKECKIHLSSYKDGSGI